MAEAGGPAAFEALIGHRFTHPELLIEALTHPSALSRRDHDGRHYQRLEFLGDRVLGLIIAEWLWRHYPKVAEGELARWHTHMVRHETVADVARGIGLGTHLRLSPGEEMAGMRDHKGVLADACEAVIAAIYLDGGLLLATRIVEEWWGKYLTGASSPPMDAKTKLQEWAQSLGRKLPAYETLAAEGPAHARRFTVRVTVTGLPPATATGSSKRLAETAAAAELLKEIGVPHHEP
ncbi:MAG TPA: ribonuclease III [Stellaceae bacterium]|nr:ribonuclease III [Stellaceae bacterium]